MVNLALWAAAIVPSITRSILAAVGFGIFTIVGLTAITGTIEQYIYTSVGGFSSDLLMVLNLGGMSAGLNIVLGAFTARIALYVLTNSRRIIGA